MNTKQERVIKERIDPRLLDAIENVYPGVKWAIFDLIDNDLDAAKPEYSTLINLTVEKDKFVSTSYGGEGMDVSDLESFFVWGKSGKRRRLGRYGHGGKTAISYLARKFSISCAKEQGKKWDVVGETITKRDLGLKEYNAVASGENRGRAFVRIELNGLKRKIDSRVLQQEIASTYAPALRKKKIVVYVNDEKVEPLEIFLAGSPEWFEFQLSGGIKISGWVGILDKDKPQSSHVRPGMRGYVFDRLITSGLMFGHQTAEQDSGVRLLVGEFNIDSDEVTLTSAKNDFDRDSRIWLELISPKMHEILTPFIEKLSEFSETGRVPKGDRVAVDAAVKALKLGLISLKERLPSLITGRLRVRMTELSKMVDRQHPINPVHRKIDDEKNKVEGRHPVSGFPEIRFRDLGGEVRSEVIEESSGKVLLINPNYAAYQIAREKNVLILYVIECATFELARIATSDHKGQEDYDRLLKFTFESLLAASIKAGRKAKLY